MTHVRVPQPLRAILTLAALAAIAIFTAGCSSSAPAPTSQLAPTAASSQPSAGTAMILGDTIPLAKGSVGPTGGQVKVEKPGDPLDGLAIVVPPKAYAATTAFDVASAPIKGHSFGPDFEFISPLIEIENGGGDATANLALRVPVKVSPDHFAMGFYVDGDRVEPIPTIVRDATSITLRVRHFSKIAVAQISDPILLEPSEACSTVGGEKVCFQQGVDTWQFTNRGTFAEAGGHCAGSSASMVYYYVEKRVKGNAPPLFGLFDNYANAYQKTPDLEEDDTLAHRLVSAAQDAWVGEVNPALRGTFDAKDMDINYILNATDEQMELDTFRDLCYALRSGEPQFVGVHRLEDKGKHTGHAVVAYRKSGPTELDGKNVILFSIADPNYPNRPEAEATKLVFNLDTSLFEPFLSAPKADAKGYLFDTIMFDGKGDMSWQQLGELWDGFEWKGVGESLFPRYTLVVQEAGSAKTATLAQNYESGSARISVAVNAEGFSPKLTVYDGAAKALGSAEGTAVDVMLAPGVNNVGFYVQGLADGQYHWLDFQWLSIIYQPGAGTPSPAVTPARTATPAAPTRTPAPASSGTEKLFADVQCDCSDLTASIEERQVGRNYFQCLYKHYADDADWWGSFMTIQYDPTPGALDKEYAKLLNDMRPYAGKFVQETVTEATFESSEQFVGKPTVWHRNRWIRVDDFLIKLTFDGQAKYVDLAYATAVEAQGEACARAAIDAVRPKLSTWQFKP